MKEKRKENNNHIILNASDLHSLPCVASSSFSAVWLTHPAGFPALESRDSLLLATILNCDLCSPDLRIGSVGSLLRVKRSLSIFVRLTPCSLSSEHSPYDSTTNSDELPINVLKPSDQRVFDGLLDLSLDETSGEWSEGVVQESWFNPSPNSKMQHFSYRLAFDGGWASYGESLVIMVVGDSVIRWKFDEVMRLHLDDVRE